MWNNVKISGKQIESEFDLSYEEELTKAGFFLIQFVRATVAVKGLTQLKSVFQARCPISQVWCTVWFFNESFKQIKLFSGIRRNYWYQWRNSRRPCQLALVPSFH